LFHNSNLFVSCIIHILYIECAKIKNNNSGAKRLIYAVLHVSLESLDDILKSNYKMKINSTKTEVMVCSKDFENNDIQMVDNAL